MNARLLIVLFLFLAVGCLLIPEGREEGDGVTNSRPQIRITAGASSGDSAGVDYRVEFEWFGVDEDGAVVAFEYAIDDTSTSEAWIDTTRTRVSLKLPATHAGGFRTDDTLSDWHTFYVRAIDNESAVSLPDSRHFNARTIAPVTRILFPPPDFLGAWPFADPLMVEWEGEDFDSSLPDRRPVFFEYKLIRISDIYSSDEETVDSLHVKENLLLDPPDVGDRTRWIRIPGSITSATLTGLPDPGAESYVFCVRAVDEARAVEPKLERGENWFVTYSGPPITQPLTVFGHHVGWHTFPADGYSWEVEVPAGLPVGLCFPDRPSYLEINYGLNVPDPLDDRYYVGWARRDCLDQPLLFPYIEDGHTHVLYLRLRLQPGGPPQTRVYTIVLKVVAPTFERTALLVDDAKIDYPGLGLQQDEIHDEFVMRFIGRILHYAPQGIDARSMYRPRNVDREGLDPTENQALTLGEMLRYDAILWNFNYTGGASTGLWYHENEPWSGSLSPPAYRLSSYLAAGGKLFLFGGRPVAALVSRNGRPDLEYPKAPPQSGISKQSFTDQGFLWNFLHVRSQVVGVSPAFHCYGVPPDDHQTWRDGLLACTSRNPAYPDLQLDPQKWNTELDMGCPQTPPPPLGGIRDYEGILHDSQSGPIFREAGLDTLYTSICYDWQYGQRSEWHGAVIAQRYTSTAADTLNGRPQGRTILFLFQPYPFYEGPAIEAGTAAVNWLMTGSDY